MNKTLHRNDTLTTPYLATKDWALSNVANDDIILMESGNPVALEFINFAPTIATENSNCNLAKENQSADKILYREGQKLSGIFYPDLEPTNIDGTFKRLVYAQVKSMFYNNYRDPTKIWGMEKLDFDESGIKKFLADKFKMFDVPTRVMGEKIIENTIQMFDTTLDNDYSVTDDGQGNLFAGLNLFSHQQEIGKHNNAFATGSDNSCADYFNFGPPVAPVSLSAALLSGPSALLTWLSGSTFPPQTGFVIMRGVTSDTSSFVQVDTVGSTILTYTDTSITESAIYYYGVLSFNTFDNSSFSNIALIASASIINQPQSVSASVGSNMSFAVTASGSPSFLYQWYSSSLTLTDDSRTTGSTTNNLRLNTVAISDTKSFFVTVRNALGGVTSSTALLFVLQDQLFDSTNSLYISGPYDTFQGYNVGDMPGAGGFGWQGAWQTASIGAGDFVPIISLDDFSSYNSGSSISTGSGGTGWLTAWSGSS